MKRYIVRLSAVLLVLILALSLGGCGKKDSTSEGAAQEAPAADTGPSFLDIARKYPSDGEVEAAMTTEELMDTYMAYPFLDILCFEPVPAEAYAEWLYSDIGCGPELISRADVATAALAVYKELLAEESTAHLQTEEEIDREMAIDWVELLLLQSEVKAKATEEEKAQILEQARLRDERVLENGYAITDSLPDLAAAYEE